MEVQKMKLDKAIACFKAIGLTPKVGSFQDRLVIQKAIYLLQQKGIKMGFGYGLHVRGPYSPSLTKEIFGNVKKIEKLETSEKLTSVEGKIVEEFNELFSGLTPSMLEIAATYSYFTMELHEDPITAQKNVKRIKSFYSAPKIATGVSKAKEFLFQPTKKELDELKEETKAWREASLKTIKE